MEPLALLLLASPGRAEPPEASLHGDLKPYFLAARISGGDAEPTYVGAGLVNGRLQGVLSSGSLRAEAHWAFSASTGGLGGATVAASTGAAASAPELLPLSWSPDLGEDLSFQHRIDRLVLSARLNKVDLTVGRQPVSFGAGRFFTPMDLVNPFGPATIDSEFKPGVDALRVDAYPGQTGKVTAVAAWAGQPVVGERAVYYPSLDDLVLASSGQLTVGVTDVLGFLGYVRAEPVLGLGAVSSVGPVGVHGEGTLTLPQDDDPFVRAVVGADGRPGPKTTLMGELYVQTLGAGDPEGYLSVLSSERATRGELWLAGRYYAAVAVAQELTPLVSVNGSVIANLGDPSALLAVGGSCSLADEADLVFGGYWGLGEAPSTGMGAITANSEFGMYPIMGYITMRAYF